MNVVFQIVDWDRHYENNKSRLIKKPAYLCRPNKNGQGKQLVLAAEHGLAVYGMWNMLLDICSSQVAPRDGFLTEDGHPDSLPLSFVKLANTARTTPEFVEYAMRILSSPDVGWIKVITQDTTAAYPNNTTRALPTTAPGAPSGSDSSEPCHGTIAIAPQNQSDGIRGEVVQDRGGTRRIRGDSAQDLFSNGSIRAESATPLRPPDGYSRGNGATEQNGTELNGTELNGRSFTSFTLPDLPPEIFGDDAGETPEEEPPPPIDDLHRNGSRGRGIKRTTSNDATARWVDAIYAAYPLKREPAAAKPAIAKAIAALRSRGRKDAAAYLLERTRMFAEATHRRVAAEPDHMRYVKYPERWFKRGCYDEEPATWEPSSAQPLAPSLRERTNHPNGEAFARKMEAFQRLTGT